MKTLAQKIFDILPDSLRLVLFELYEDEERLMDILSETQFKISEYLAKRERSLRVQGEFVENLEKAVEFEQDINSMKFLLCKYENGRFKEYFSKRIDAYEEVLGFLLKH